MSRYVIPEGTIGAYQREAGAAFGAGTIRFPCDSFLPPKSARHKWRCIRCEFPPVAHARGPLSEISDIPLT